MSTEERIFELQRHAEVMDAKFEMFMQYIKDGNDKRDAEMKDFKNEMRQHDHENMLNVKN